MFRKTQSLMLATAALALTACDPATCRVAAVNWENAIRVWMEGVEQRRPSWRPDEGAIVCAQVNAMCHQEIDWPSWCPNFTAKPACPYERINALALPPANHSCGPEGYLPMNPNGAVSPQGSKSEPIPTGSILYPPVKGNVIGRTDGTVGR